MACITKPPSMTFHFQDLTPFQADVSKIDRPREIADFSFDDKHICHPFSTESLRYYYPPFIDIPGVPRSRGINLSDGYKHFISQDDSVDLHLDALLQTLQEYEKREKVTVHVDFITWRGMMTKIMTAPYNEDGFSMIATRFQNTIYIEENHAAKRPDPDHSTVPHQIPREVMQYWGYKFETISTIPRPWSECTRDEIEKRPSNVVNTNAQYCSVVLTNIGEHRLLLAGEVDALGGCKRDRAEDRNPYIELKTNLDFRPDDHRNSMIFDKKLCRTWAQSYLLGVPKIIVGFRTRDGELMQLKVLDTMNIPQTVHERSRAWSGHVCVNFAAAFLGFLRKEVTGEGTWHIHRHRAAPAISVTKTSDQHPTGILYAPFKAYREEKAT